MADITIDDTYHPERDGEYRRVISALLHNKPAGPPVVETAARIAVNLVHDQRNGRRA